MDQLYKGIGVHQEGKWQNWTAVDKELPGSIIDISANIK